MNIRSVLEWQKEYEQSRYLRELTDYGLETRFTDLIGNLWSTDNKGNVTPPRNTHNRLELIRLTSHTILEQVARRSIDAFDFNETKLRESASASYTPPQLKKPFTGSPLCFAKFGKRSHIHDAYEKGILRITPADAYDDASLNPAQADKELEHFTRTPNQQIMFQLRGLNSEGEEVPLPVKPTELFRFMMVENFYVWCCGLGYDARLFHDFEAEAVLIIRDKTTFRSRLLTATKKQLPNVEATDGPIKYYDPYTFNYDQLMPIFSKNMKYLYQNEYRFSWKVSNESKMEPLFVELGPLNDIADFLELV